VFKGIINGKYFREVNGNPVPETDLNPEDIDNMKELHYCHFGLLMELKASGMVLDEKVKIIKFQGADYLSLNFTCDTIRIKTSFFKNISSWNIFIDPANYSIKGWEADGLMGMKGYAVYTGNLRINGIDMPLIKTYYSTADNSFLAIDLFTNAK
jgi:hypothetical protein